MPLYFIEVQRDVIHSINAHVESSSPEEAKKELLATLVKEPPTTDYTWEILCCVEDNDRQCVPGMSADAQPQV